MKLKNLASAAAIASLGVFAGCSDSSTPSPVANGIDGNVNVIGGAVASNTNYNAARVKLSQYSHSVVNEWEMDTTAVAPDTVPGSVAAAFREGGNFAIEADVAVDSSDAYTVASAGIGGTGSAWLLQVDNGEVIFKWREKKDDEWTVLKADKDFRLGEWNDIRLEHVDSLSVLIVNGEIAGAYQHNVHLGNIQGDITFGYDRTESDRTNSDGRIAVIRIEHTFNIYVVPAESSGSEEVTEDSTLGDRPWIAAWEFKDAENVGRDFSGNGHTAVIGEGSVPAAGGVAKFDGKSGFSVPLTPDFKINDFVIESRFKPASSSRFNNILVSEPPGRYGDGWIFRLGYGKLYFNIRDEANGTGWSEFEIAPVPMNEWTVARVERLGDEISFFINDTLIKVVKFNGDVSDLTYNWGLGYDAMNQAIHERYFDGEIDYIRFGENLESAPVEVVPVDTTKADTVKKDVEEQKPEEQKPVEEKPVEEKPVEEVVDTAEVVEKPVSEVEGDWIAAWEFNDAENIGRDFTGNGHTAKIGEGAVVAIDGIAAFNGKSGFSVALANNININEFVVEARVKPAQFGTMQNIIVAEPPGRGVDGWQLRIDEGVLTVHLRDSQKDGDNWNIFPGKKMTLGEWSTVRVERSNDSLKVFQDGELTVSVAYTGDLTQMRYDWGLGYDAMNQAFHNRYFIGEMDYVRFGKFEGFSTADGVAPVEVKPLAAWEFNEPTYVGLDRMANNSTRNLVGAPKIADSTVILDGESGLQVALSPTFARNTFAVEARVKPTKFGGMQNIIVAEPPGCRGDGWIIRLDNGVLDAYFRDENTDGSTWNSLYGQKLALDEWTTIRVERSADSIKVFQNGELTVKAAAKGDVSQLGYNIGIGYDAMNQAIHDRFFVGEIDYIRYFE
ncbi:LamG-like jellyroll fold domain-containing protein [Fibrobacter succinogenes]|uniref:LamG-like jellyroll fold domain-containing protein n=1 Tax=Fibrobacter succinogenes TaxID=833 RepID=UPI001569EF46|nr:LamG-like jellyroll fold domain-containing protein [Fibrobacter succinogenes]